MFTWVSALPPLAGFILVTGVTVAIACAGTLLARPAVHKIFGPEPGRNELVTVLLTVGGVFYGLLIGLMVVAGYEQFKAGQNTVADEAATLGTLYREVSAYPEPQRTILREDLVAYTDNVLTVAWPALREGEEPQGGTALVTRFQEHLLAFEPQTSAQEIIHAAALDEFASFDSARRHRINATANGLPAVMWTVIVIGAAVNLALVCLYSFKDYAAHLLLSGIFAFFLGTMLFLIAVLDHPFRAAVGVSPEPFQSMYTNVMGR